MADRGAVTTLPPARIAEMKERRDNALQIGPLWLLQRHYQADLAFLIGEVERLTSENERLRDEAHTLRVCGALLDSVRKERGL